MELKLIADRWRCPFPDGDALLAFINSVNKGVKNDADRPPAEDWQIAILDGLFDVIIFDFDQRSLTRLGRAAEGCTKLESGDGEGVSIARI